MTRKRVLAVGIGLAFLAMLVGCALFNSPPTAMVTAAPTAGPSPLTVAFDASGSTDSGTIATYAWSFGDGSTGTGVTTSHTYTLVGSFTAVVTVTDNYGATDTASIGITVSAPLNASPTASFTATPASGANPLTVQFNAGASSDSDGSIASYAWDFGDGDTGTGITATHTYTTPGVYVALLTVTDDEGATDTTDQTITVTAPGNSAPVAAFTNTGSTGFLLPITVTFDGTASYDDDGSIIAYNWNFGDGESGAGSTISHAYDSFGVYTVVLIVVDNDGAIGSRSKTIHVKFQAIVFI